jgi:hypothetical protein
MDRTGPAQHTTVAHLYRSVFFTTSPTNGADRVMAIELGRRCAPERDKLSWKTISKMVLQPQRNAQRGKNGAYGRW